ncbi:hypothetical protein D3C85_955650 [compost metagenome]
MTRARITSSDREITTICNPVGNPMRSTLARIARSRRIAANSARSSARAWPLRFNRHASIAMAARLPARPASAALWMPICGKPNQPRINAGVSNSPTQVDTTSANKGESVSLTPRSNWVNSTNTSNGGMIHIITRA